MPNYRPPVSRSEYHDLEIYYHKLITFTYQHEFRDMKTEKQSRIYHEIAFMEIALNIMREIFVPARAQEKEVMGWKVNLSSDEPELLYKFSSIKVAAGVTGCNQSKISAVCQGKRKNTSASNSRDALTGKVYKNVYKFVYASDFLEEKYYSLNEILNNAKEKTSFSDGNV